MRSARWMRHCRPGCPPPSSTGAAGGSAWPACALLLHGSRPTRAAPGREVYHLLGPGAADPLDAGSTLDESRMSADLGRRERRLFSMTVGLSRPMPTAPAGTPAPASSAAP